MARKTGQLIAFFNNLGIKENSNLSRTTSTSSLSSNIKQKKLDLNLEKNIVDRRAHLNKIQDFGTDTTEKKLHNHENATCAPKKIGESIELATKTYNYERASNQEEQQQQAVFTASAPKDVSETTLKFQKSRKEQNERDKSDEMFGFNDFDEKESEVFEAYNYKGRELVMIILTRRILTANNLEENLVQNFDFAFSTAENTEEHLDKNVSINNCGFDEEDSFSEDEENEYAEINQISEVGCTSLEKNEKIIHIIEELIQTEESYIEGLEIVVKDYKPFLTTKIPAAKATYIFGNIEHIYEHAKEFLKLLTEAKQEADKIAELFVNNVELFAPYSLYFRNKPTADKIIKEFDKPVKHRQGILKDSLGLHSYLMTPIQRLAQYTLLLENIQKELEKNNKPLKLVEQAIEVVRNSMKKGNDYIAKDSIKQSAIDLELHGSFIMRASFDIIEPLDTRSMVFLFEKVVVFTEEIADSEEEYKYIDSIPMSDLSVMDNIKHYPNIFHLINYTKAKQKSQDAKYILEADTVKIKNDWVSEIQKELRQQFIQLKVQRTKSNKRYMQ